MLVDIFKNINGFFINFFHFLSFRKNQELNNDVESCCILLNDHTTTCSE